jgi:hypothetical protein
MSRSSARMLLQESNQMARSTDTEAGWSGKHLSISPRSELDREQRIMRALAVRKGSIPRVDEATLSTYYRYLSANLSLPFAAHFPEPSSPQEEADVRCLVLELLDPVKYLGDGFDGIFCKTRKGCYEVNLPLLDLYLPEESPDFQLIEDYWYWFWNWR